MKTYDVIMNADGYVIVRIKAENEDKAREIAEWGDWEDNQIVKNNESYIFEDIEEVK